MLLLMVSTFLFSYLALEGLKYQWKDFDSLTIIVSYNISST